MIRNIIFDLGRVLMDFEWNDYIHKLFDDETARKVTMAMWGTGYWKELDRAVLTEEEILELFFSAGPDVKDEILEAFNRAGECAVKRDWVVPMIEDLKKSGYNVYFLSNLSQHMLKASPEAFACTSAMDGGIFSCDVRVIKPDPEIYRLLFEKYSLVPEECIFIDDHRDNIAMARKFGMKGIVFDNREQFEADLDKALTKDKGHEKISVLCYGDSNTYGYEPATGGRYAPEKRWTNILADKLGDRYEVISEGLNGRTTAFDRPGEAWKNGASTLISCLGTHKPVDYLIIMLGTNDCNSSLGLTAEDIAGGMERLVSLTEEKSPALQGYIPEIIVAATPAISGDRAGSPFAAELTDETAQKSRDIEPLYRQLAERHLVRFVSATDSADIVKWDCTHLSELGHRQMADLILNEINRDPASYDVEQSLVP